MYKNILLCLDGSPQDESVVQAGLWLGEKFGATLHGLHVKDILTLEGPLLYDISGALSFIPQMNFLEETRKLLVEKGKQVLSQFEQACQERKIHYQTYLEEGVVYKTILEKAHLHDLTLIGRRGHDYKLDHDLLGSAADRVIRRIKSPTMVVTHKFTEFHSPLLAYDGSPEAKEAMVSAVHFLSPLKLPLTVLNVNKDPERGRELLEEVKSYLDSYPQIPVRYEQTTGVPRQVILEYAMTHHHDLLILGARGDRLVDLLLGSTTLYALWQGSFHVWVDR